MISKDKLNKFGELLQQHKTLYPELSLKAEQFEALFAIATNADWKPYNHNPGSDMSTTLEGMLKPSLKSGIMKNEYLTISSHRTTKYKTLEDKLNFLSNTDYDSYICLARPDNKVHNYKLVYFPKSLINFNNLVWEETKTKKGEFNGWYATNENQTIKVSIVKSMSHQVWIDIHKSLITIIESYNYDVTE